MLNQLLVNFWFYVLFFRAQSSCGVIYNQLCTGPNPCSIEEILRLSAGTETVFALTRRTTEVYGRTFVATTQEAAGTALHSIVNYRDESVV